MLSSFVLLRRIRYISYTVFPVIRSRLYHLFNPSLQVPGSTLHSLYIFPHPYLPTYLVSSRVCLCAHHLSLSPVPSTIKPGHYNYLPKGNLSALTCLTDHFAFAVRCIVKTPLRQRFPLCSRHIFPLINLTTRTHQHDVPEPPFHGGNTGRSGRLVLRSGHSSDLYVLQPSNL